MDNTVLKKAKKANDLAVLVNRTSLTFVGGTLDRPTQIKFDGKAVLDLEVIDRKVFSEQILSVIEKQESKLNFVLLFSDDSSFFKDIPLTSTAPEIETFEKQFLSLVPFDKVAHKLVKLSNNYRLVAVNWGICDVLSETLKLQGYNLEMVIPAFVVPNFDQKAGLTEATASSVFSRLSNLAGFNLAPDKNQSDPIPVRSVVTSKKSHLPLLVGVFVFLILILGFLLARR